jgi:hypothetical protein
VTACSDVLVLLINSDSQAAPPCNVSPPPKKERHTTLPYVQSVGYSLGEKKKENLMKYTKNLLSHVLPRCISQLFRPRTVRSHLSWIVFFPCPKSSRKARHWTVTGHLGLPTHALNSTVHLRHRLFIFILAIRHFPSSVTPRSNSSPLYGNTAPVAHRAYAL